MSAPQRESEAMARISSREDAIAETGRCNQGEIAEYGFPLTCMYDFLVPVDFCNSCDNGTLRRSANLNKIEFENVIDLIN